MNDVVVQCPYCHELVTIELDPDTEGSLVQDCEVCCRPWQLHITRLRNGEVDVRVERAQ